MIYFIQSGEGGPIKIGSCQQDRAKARLTNLQTGNPNKCRILAVMDGDASDEQGLHATFRQHRKRGEWFEPAADIIDFIGRNGRKLERQAIVPHGLHPLVEFSKRTGKSITAIAKDAGCSRMTLYRIMSGDNTTIDQLQKISAATNGEVQIGAFLPVSLSELSPS